MIDLSKISDSDSKMILQKVVSHMEEWYDATLSGTTEEEMPSGEDILHVIKDNIT